MTATAHSGDERARIARIAGSLVEARPAAASALYELALVGSRGLFGEVVRVAGEVATLQVYEETVGLALGEPVAFTGEAMAVSLGPGLIGSVLDGVGRPLARIAEHSGDFIAPGISAPTLDAAQRWTFEPVARVGSRLQGGDVLGTVPERGVLHRVLVPPGVHGTLRELRSGEFGVEDVIGSLDDGTLLRLAQRWPVRRERPVARRLPAHRPFITTQRIFDFLFPLAEGGSAAVPGGFGTGKTVIEQSLAKFAEADVVVYVGCGERGNEMAEVLSEFPRLLDPRTGRPVMDRAVLVVNTSNMPVAARETSIYLGATIAEYYRDMGLRVALMVDSISRWAEALREIAARLQEMPGEEGYPTTLASRLGRFFERSGRASVLGAPEREGTVTIIAAVSPPAGDFSEPVTQAALRVCGALWALDPALAHQRHFPAVDWETSYSLYDEALAPWLVEHAGADWHDVRRGLLGLLQRERELREVTALVGPESLEDADRLAMSCAAMVRETLLRQNANHPHDASTTLDKTFALAQLLHATHERAAAALGAGAPLRAIELEPVRRAIAALRDAPRDAFAESVARARAAVEAVGGGRHR